MKYLSLLLFMLFINCKSEDKPKTPEALWQDYIATYPEHSTDVIPDADFFHNNEADANRLGQLILAGKKRAGSSLYSLYRKYEMDLPQPGKMQIVTDFDGNALALIETIAVDTVPFNQISAAYAAKDMGTEDNALKKWKKEHWDFFEYFLDEMGEKPSGDMLIVCEQFKKVWPDN